MLLSDISILDNITILEESKSAGTMRIRGIFQRADEPNNNNRIYERKLLEREITRLAENLTNRRLLGELDHPSYDSVKLQNVSHVVTGLKMQGNEMIGEAELLGTPAGLTAQALIRGGVNLGISSRGMGTLTDIEGVRKKVNEDFKLITFDLVADPSTKGAYPGVVTESTIIEEAVRSNMNKFTSERIFITLLKNSLKK
jgi:hypothetical protein